MKICVGLSGGVDSSVAALLLKRQGADVFAMYMQNWHDVEGTLHGDCEWEEEKFVAEMVARKLGIPFYFVDLSKEYMFRVADYMFDEYSKGRTPNPDVLCNSKIKFDAFMNAARSLGADMVATGHYCRREPVIGPDGVRKTGPDGKPLWSLLEGTDLNKCQAYFLCRLSQEQLGGALFPIGHLDKGEVRRIAAEAELPSADRKDSQGICFVGKVDLPVFLQQKLKSKEGDVIEIPSSHYDSLPEPQSIEEKARALKYTPEDGRVIGKHIGAQFYTIGQRKGLGIGGYKEPLFVIATDIAGNRIYLGEGQDHPGLYREALKILPGEIHWIRTDLEMKPGSGMRVRLRIRYRQPLQDGTLIMKEDGMYVLFDKPQRGVTPGQFCVWYSDDGSPAPEVLGSGVISE
ncbi:MAG: tRNA 2-thiouridine(34) synthase MnmA [Bacteroidales bacterium]|nr:tRNA 2-thiouridine(34) synthase MnmA [Bacteroidales bacterium]